MPEEDKKKKAAANGILDAEQIAADAIQQANEENAAAIQNEANAANAVANAAAAQNNIPDLTEAQINMANKVQQNDLMEIVKQTQAAKTAAEQQDQAIEDNARKAMAWSAAGEFAAGLANLIGVGAGASHQQYVNTYSKDWMNRADEARRNVQLRRDRYQEKLNSLNTQLSELRTKGVKDIIDYRQNKRKQDIAQRRADSMAALTLARQAVQDATTKLKNVQAEIAQAKLNGENAKVAKLNAQAEAIRKDIEIKQQKADDYSTLVSAQVDNLNARTRYTKSKTPSGLDQFE